MQKKPNLKANYIKMALKRRHWASLAPLSLRTEHTRICCRDNSRMRRCVALVVDQQGIIRSSCGEVGEWQHCRAARSFRQGSAFKYLDPSVWCVGTGVVSLWECIKSLGMRLDISENHLFKATTMITGVLTPNILVWSLPGAAWTRHYVA